jgi:DNA-binding NarL/FixJ family response regulator
VTVPRHSQDARSPLHDWRVATDARGTARSYVRRETPFIGREDLLHQFHQIVAQVRETDRLVVRLTGETGIGKTRLLRELARRGTLLGLDVLWTDGRPSPSPALPPRDGRPRLVMLDASSPLDRLPDHSPDLSVLTPEGSDRGPVVTFLALRPALDAAGLPVRRLLATLARERALVEMPVPPLSEAELFELTSHLLDGPPNARLHETISSLSEGNPFLAEELTADLVQLGLVGCERGTWYLLSSVPPGYVPAGVETALSFDLDAVDPDVLQTLACAAVLGAGFRFDVLAAAMAGSHDHLMLHLETGLAHGVLSEAAAPPDDFQFTHELMRRVLYRRLSGVRRRRLHQAVAEALERQLPRADPSDQSATLAFHFMQGVDRERAIAYILRAQERAEHLLAWDDAIRYCREGLDLARQTDTADLDLQLDLLERLGALYFGQAQTFATGACWREALHVCEQAAPVSSELRRAALAGRLAALGPSWCSIESAEAILAAALGASTPGVPAEAAWRFDAYHELGLAHQRVGQLAEAVRYLEQAADVVDLADWPRRALAPVSLADALITAGRPAAAVVLLRASLALLEAGSPEQLVHLHQLNYLRDPRRIRCLALAVLVRALTCLGEIDEASSFAARVTEEEQQFGILGGRAQRVSAQLELARGRPEEAVRLLEGRLRQSAAGSLGAHRVADLLLLAQAYLAQGRADLALDTASEGVRLSQRSGAAEHLAGLYVVTAGALLERAEPEAAATAVREAHHTIERTGAEQYRSFVRLIEARSQIAVATLPPGPASALNGPTVAPNEADRLSATVSEPVSPRPASDTGVRTRSARSSELVYGRSLTGREHEVLRLMAEGRTNRQIAQALILSDKTVKRHLSNIFNKLGVSTRAAAVRGAFRAGLL